jgi:hypothetical protein
MDAVLRDLARATGRRITVSADETSIRMQIVSAVAQGIFEHTITWAQVGHILGTPAEPKLVKKAVRDIARTAQDELARRVMSAPMTRPSPAPACAPAKKEI